MSCWRIGAKPKLAVVAAAALLLAVFVPRLVTPGGRVGSAGAAPALSVRVSGNHLVDGSGNGLELHGVDRSGTEYACIQGWGIFDGPSDAASVAAIASWHVNAVRVPLNEDCWLGINGVSSSYGGAAYQHAIVNYVNLLNQYGIYAILDLHWSAPGTTAATGQEPMPDQDHSPAFWTSVAGTFRSNPAVLFDLFNEPYPDSNTDTTAAWTCWEDGGSCAGVSYPAAGMQELVNTVRSTGATNVIMLGGIQYAGTLDHWANYKPTDPDGQLAASFHNYNFGGCVTTACWSSSLSAIGNVPLITGELGENDGAASFIDSYMNWADTNGVSYLAWTWDTWGCGSPISLITNYNGTPCASYGSGYQQHLAAIAASGPPATTTTTTTTIAPTTTTTVPPRHHRHQGPILSTATTGRSGGPYGAGPADGISPTGRRK
jgi:endoglucanase